MASLIVTSGKSKGEYLPLGRRISVIGRAETLPLQVLDALVSRKHLRIKYDDATSKYLAEDLDSKHGTFVNKHKLSEPTTLAEGDEILLGETTLMFTDEDFDTQENALMHYKKFGEKERITLIE